MKTFVSTLVAGSLLAISAGAFAAKPTSIVFDANGKTAEGTEYGKYHVKCSNGKELPLTAWENRRKWCVGEDSSENCEKKQIKAAKKACKAA
jgi:hypothetical protein